MNFLTLCRISKEPELTIAKHFVICHFTKVTRASWYVLLLFLMTCHDILNDIYICIPRLHLLYGDKSIILHNNYCCFMTKSAAFSLKFFLLIFYTFLFSKVSYQKKKNDH